MIKIVPIPTAPDTKPCLASDLKMAKNERMETNKCNNRCAKLKLGINAKPKFNVAIIAIIAAAKFGLPTVEITALYGLFHFTKSTPDICISP